MKNVSALDQFETNPAPLPVPLPSQRTSDGFRIVDHFARADVFVRTEVLAGEKQVTPNSLIPVGARNMKTSDLMSVADLEGDITIGTVTFKKARIIETKPGFESMKGKVVYIWSAAF
jgi:hypothetical protein